MACLHGPLSHHAETVPMSAMQVRQEGCGGAGGHMHGLGSPGFVPPGVDNQIIDHLLSAFAALVFHTDNFVPGRFLLPM